MEIIVQTILFILLAGIPYFFFLEKKKVDSEKIFLMILVTTSLGLILNFLFGKEYSSVFVIIALFTSFFALYKALKTTNLYKIGYYFFFINAPVYFLFDIKFSVYYIFSLLITLFGIFLVGRYYKNTYGSANFYTVAGLALETPLVGLFLRLYLIDLALYPPFPNSVFFFNSLIHNQLDLLWYLVIAVVFFGNFFISMRVLTKTVFGDTNKNIFYVDLNKKDTRLHLLIVVFIIGLGIYGLKEVLT